MPRPARDGLVITVLNTKRRSNDLHPVPFNAVAFSRDGKMVGAGGALVEYAPLANRDEWDVKNGEPEPRLVAYQCQLAMAVATDAVVFLQLGPA